MAQIHASLSTGGHGLDYDIQQNSNSYVTTVLSVVGIDIGTYLDPATPPDVSGFPGVGTNILQGAKTGGLFSGYDTPIPLTLTGTVGDDYILAGIGNDLLGGAGGNDEIHSGSGSDLVTGGAGNDWLFGGAGNDTLDGGEDNDTLIGGDGADSINGQGGIDTVSYAGAAAAVTARLDGGANGGAATGDVILGVENLEGSDFDDLLVGNVGDNLIMGSNGNDVIYALSGNDTLIGGAGTDTLNGQGGNDTVSYAGAAVAVTARLDSGANGGAAAGDVILGIENLSGTAFNDLLAGNPGMNVIDGSAGNDIIYAQNGNDVVIGGAGNDILFGQGGNDRFVFADGFGTDVLMDFRATKNMEKIDLSAVSAITDWADLTNAATPHMTQAGADVVIDDFAGNTITLVGANLVDLHEIDFVF